MAVIKHAEAQRMARDALVLDLGEIGAQAQQLKAAARAEADRILAEARAERDRLIQGAREEGYAQGLATGEAEGRAEGKQAGRAEALEQASQRLASLESAWSQALSTFSESREQLVAEAHDEIGELATTAIEKLLRRAVDLDTALIQRLLEDAIRSLIDRSRLVIHVHPDDEALVRDALPAIASRLDADGHADIVTDASMARGGCVVRNGRGGEVDASIEVQLERIVEAVRPGGGQIT